MSVVWTAYLFIFFLVTLLITFLFDIITRDDWREEYGTITGPQPKKCLMSRWMQIVLLAVLQQVLMTGILFYLVDLYYIPTGDPLLNDMVFTKLCEIAAWIALFFVNIPWLLCLTGNKLWFRYKTRKPVYLDQQ